LRGEDAAQALGLRPWLAALPLRERRLRARLLMCAPNGVVSDRSRSRSLPLWHISKRGSDLEFAGGDLTRRPTLSVGAARTASNKSRAAHQQIDANRRKLTPNSVTAMPFSPQPRRERHTQVLFSSPKAQRCHSKSASERNRGIEAHNDRSQAAPAKQRKIS
jgi:hypothetical protein